MTEELKKTIETELAELPKYGQEAIANINWLKITEDVGKANDLDEEDVEDLQLETLLVLIGSVYPEDYAINIENHVNTTKEKSENLAKELFVKVFTPLQKILAENAKKNLGNIEFTPEQSIDFIHSGGDYTSLIEK